MKHLFYEDWTKKRLDKIINIFGKEWFLNKKILELGACHGDIGLELLKLGADVTFSDARREYLETIEKTLLESYNYKPNLLVLNQEENYSLGNKFDLILHLGLLYNLKNWKNDLKNILNHTDIMILETMVNTQNKSLEIESPYGFNYGPFNEGIMSVVSPQEIENELTQLGCKFLRFDNSSLNSEGWFYKECQINHVYDWTEEKFNLGWYKNTPSLFYHFRRFWIILK